MTEEEFLAAMKLQGSGSTTEDESEGVAQEFFEGIASGFIGIGEGVAELGALGVDIIADTNYATDVREAAASVRESLGIDPAGFVGKGVEALVQFGVPGIAAVSAVSKASKLGQLKRSFDLGGEALTKGQKFALGAQQLTAAGLADAAVATNNITTIGDFFEGSPTSKDMTFGLTGREEAARLLLNRAKVGAEGAAAFVAAPYLIKGVGAVAAPVLSPVARRAQEAAKPISEAARRLEERYVMGDETLGKVGEATARTMAALRYRSFLPNLVGDLRSVVPGMTQAQIKKATNLSRVLEKEVTKTVKELARVQGGDTKLMRQETMDTIEEWMTAPKDPDTLRAIDGGIQQAFDELPNTVKESVLKMRDQVDTLSRDILNSDYLKRAVDSSDETVAETAEAVKAAIEKNMHSYLRGRYRMFEDPTYVPDAATIQAGVNGFKNSASATLSEIEKAYLAAGRETDRGIDIFNRFLRTDEEGLLQLKSVEVTDDAAKFATDNFIARYKPKVRKGSLTEQKQRAPAEYINTDLFKNREELRKFQRQLLGEIKGPTENFIGTVADLATFRAVDDYFGKIRSLAESGDAKVSKMFVPQEATAPSNFVPLKDERFGSLVGFQVPEAVYRDMTRRVQQDSDLIPDVLRSMYSGFLQAKGITQYSKTVLSPVTQIRNVTTASMFALAQGNVGSGANLGESVSYVLNNLRRLPDKEKAEFLEELQEFGLIGQQAELRELQELIGKGLVSNKLISNEAGTALGQDYVRRQERGRLGNFLGDVAEKFRGVTQTAEDLYQGGDDVWKIYNYQFELTKLKRAFARMTPEEQAAELARRSGRSQDEILPNLQKEIRREAANIVRNTVPNYSLAPEAIRNLRQLPVGNFIAFPYEIYRTGFNTFVKAIDELASTNSEIQQIGLRRLTGAVGTFSILPTAVAGAAYEFSGVSEEEMKAYQRQFAYPWQKNSLLIPTGRTEEGLPTYIDFSYSNPYDQLARAGRAIMTAYETGLEEGQSASKIVETAAFESIGETFAPFLGPSIISEKLQDVLPRELFGRGGVQITGAKVYDDDESVPTGEKVAKSAIHLIDAIIPNAVPISVRSGTIEPSRFVRGLAELGEDDTLFGVSNVDKNGREFKLSQELARAFSGVTEIEPIEGNNFEYKAADFSRRRRFASSLFNRVADDVNATPQDLLSAFIKADQARYRIYSDLYQTVEDLRRLGYSDSEIRKKFKIHNVNVGRILRNKYEPLSISNFTRRAMRRAGTLQRLPRGEINEYLRSRRNIEFLSSEELQEEQRSEAPSFRSFFTPEPAQETQINSALQLPSAPAPATMTPATSPQQPTSPSLLGDNPIEQARNLELMQRLRGQ